MKKLFLLFFLTVFIEFTAYCSEYYISTTSLNIRTGPGTNYPSIHKIETGEEVEVVAKTNPDWYQINFNSQIGYVASKYLKPIQRSSKELAKNGITSWVQENQFACVLIVILIVLIGIAIRLETKRKTSLDYQPNFSELSNLNRPNYIVTKSTKNVGLSIFLAIIFPYFGILYASVSLFCWLFFSYIAMWVILLFVGIKTLNDGILFLGMFLSFIHFGISIIWTGIAANNYNKRLLRH